MAARWTAAWGGLAMLNDCKTEAERLRVLMRSSLIHTNQDLLNRQSNHTVSLRVVLNVLMLCLAAVITVAVFVVR